MVSKTLRAIGAITCILTVFAARAGQFEQCRLSLASGGFLKTEPTLRYWAEHLNSFLGPAQEVALVAYASQGPERIVRMLEKYKIIGERRIVLVDAAPDPKSAIEHADAILVWGGNTFQLLNSLYQHDLIEVIRRRVLSGVPYVGSSAGTNIVAPTIMTTNDMPIVYPPSFKSLAIVPFQINPHYVAGPTYVLNSDGTYSKSGGETRDQRLNEFLKKNEVSVVGIPDASLLRIENGRVTFESKDPLSLRLFQSGQEPRDVAVGPDDLLTLIIGATSR